MKEKQDVGLEKMSYKFVKGYIEPIVALATFQVLIWEYILILIISCLTCAMHGSTWRT